MSTQQPPANPGDLLVRQAVENGIRSVLEATTTASGPMAHAEAARFIAQSGEFQVITAGDGQPTLVHASGQKTVSQAISEKIASGAYSGFIQPRAAMTLDEVNRLRAYRGMPPATPEEFGKTFGRGPEIKSPIRLG